VALYSYEIGTTSSTTNVESLTVPVNPPRGEYVPWSRTYDRGDALVGADGYPVARWKFDVLTQAQLGQLRTSSGVSGKSGACYIVTRTDAGTFSKFSCVLVWPDDQMARRAFNGRYLDLVFEFRKLVLIPPP